MKISQKEFDSLDTFPTDVDDRKKRVVSEDHKEQFEARAGLVFKKKAGDDWYKAEYIRQQGYDQNAADQITEAIKDLESYMNALEEKDDKDPVIAQFMVKIEQKQAELKNVEIMAGSWVIEWTLLEVV